MKKILLLGAALLLSACEGSRDIPVRQPNGQTIVQTVQCVGIGGEGKRAGIEYKVSTRNVVVGVLFFETVFTPVIVAINETYCPVADTTTAR